MFRFALPSDELVTWISVTVTPGPALTVSPGTKLVPVKVTSSDVAAPRAPISGVMLVRVGFGADGAGHEPTGGSTPLEARGLIDG
jgi:hypothetical protein